MTISLETQDRSYVSIEVDGKVINRVNLMKEISLTEHIGYTVPTCAITLIDDSPLLSKIYALRDGTKLRVTIGPSQKFAKTYDFMVVGYKKVTSTHNTTWNVNCVLDVPKYLMKSRRCVIEDTSAKAMMKIAEDSGLGYDGVKGPDDKQKWIALGISNSTFAQNICDHGWVDDKSAMMVTVSLEKKLLYKNLTKQMTSGEMDEYHVNTMPSGEDGAKVNEVTFYSNSGFRNNWLGTGILRFHSNIKGESPVFKDMEKVLPDKSYLAVNATNKEGIKYTRVDTTNFDCGNTHKNYEKAFYQNLRRRALFSQHADALFATQMPKGELFDNILVNAVDTFGEIVEEAGSWIVASRTIVSRGATQYAEIIGLVRDFNSFAGKTKLIGGGSV